MDQQKTITIIELKPKAFVKKDGTPGVKYMVKGNDGITYETWDQPWFLARKIGETINITFWTSTYNGRMGLRTNYNIVIAPQANGQYNTSTPMSQPSRDNPGVNANVAAMIAEIKRAETNIIAAIRVHCGTNIKGAEIPVINETANKGYTVATPTIEEEEEESDDGDNNPF
jgi:hypothetical protein